MNGGRMAVFGLATALGLGTTAAVLEYRSSASEASIVELTGEDLRTKPRDDGDDGDGAIVQADDQSAGDGGDETTRGGRGTGGATTGGQAGDSTQAPDTTRDGRGTGGKTTGGAAGDTTQAAASVGGGGYVAPASYSNDGGAVGGGGGGSGGSGGGT